MWAGTGEFVMRIAEIYQSLQGEGFLTGTDSVFVRVSGCNLRCRYCDTPFASWKPEGEDCSTAEITQRILSLPCRHVVLTGGETMLFAELIPLSQSLKARDRHVTVETAGTLYLPVACDLMSISPKLSNSTPDFADAGKWQARHEQSRSAPEAIRQIVAEYEYQFKFVIDEPADCDEVEGYLLEFPEIDRTRVMLMPEGTDQDHLARIARWLEPYCREHQLIFCPRKQIEWFGATRGT